ncbi:MAG: ribosomal protein S18-alanine N-acetyltransferase [Sphingorhabdus sp.]
MTKIYCGDARDIPAIMPVMEDAFDPSYGEAWTAGQCLTSLTLPSSKLWIAERDGQVAAFAICRWVLDEEELLMIGVARKYRRKKLASALLDHLIENAISCGRNQLFLEVRDGNEAIEFYKQSGFSKIGRRQNYYTGKDNRKSDAVTMRRQID